MYEQPLLSAGIARAIRRLREGSVIIAGGFSAWLDNPTSGFQQRLHLNTFDALCARGIIERHPTLVNGWRLKQAKNAD